MAVAMAGGLRFPGLAVRGTRFLPRLMRLLRRVAFAVPAVTVPATPGSTVTVAAAMAVTVPVRTAARLLPA